MAYGPGGCGCEVIRSMDGAMLTSRGSSTYVPPATCRRLSSVRTRMVVWLRLSLLLGFFMPG